MKNIATFLRKFVNLHFLQDLKNLARMGRIPTVTRITRSIGSVGPRTRSQDQFQVQPVKLGPSLGPLQTVPATLPRLTTQLTNLYGHGDDPTPDPQCTHTGTDPHPDPDQK